MHYEDISNVDGSKAVHNALKILKKGWVRRKYPPIHLREGVPWQLSNPAERSWNFYIHCWDMLDSLLKAHSQTGEGQFLEPSIWVALDWARMFSNPKDKALSPFAWYDMAVGLRAYRLAYIIDAGTKSGLLAPEDHELLWRSLEQHQMYLADDANISFHNNHGYYQVVAQLAMGRRFAKVSNRMAEAYVQGKARLQRMLSQQFGSDGVHREHSPDYHRMVYDTLKSLIDSRLVIDEYDIRRAYEIERSLSWFVLPNRHIVNFGDSDYRLLSRKPDEANRKWLTPEMQYVVTKGVAGALPPEDYKVFPESGYFIVRRRTAEKTEDFSHYSYLAQTAAFHSRTHKHADDLSFVWSDRGADILVDAGRYGYIGKVEKCTELWEKGFWYTDPNRIYCESTRAHNTLEFDGRDYLRKGVKPYGSAIKRWLRTDKPLFAVETEVKQHGSIRHVRVLIFNPARWLLVFDWFHDNLRHPHEVKQWFHLAPNLQLHKNTDGYHVPIPDTEQPLRVIPLLSGAVLSRPYLAEESPEMQGWWSPKEREIIPAYAFSFKQCGVYTGMFATLFDFSRLLTTETSWSRANTSGRKAKLKWKDDDGEHVVMLERPKEGSLDVVYTKK